jgi:hypothetical protein
LQHPTPIAVVNGFNAAWAEGDVDKAISFVAEDSIYALHISGEALPHGGETAGRDNIGAALRRVREDFESTARSSSPPTATPCAFRSSSCTGTGRAARSSRVASAW